MIASESQRLARLARGIRESTLKRLRRVPPGDENWRISRRAMSFADLARHLIDADEWLLRKLQERDLATMVGRPGLEEIADRAQYLALLRELKRWGDRRADRIASLTAEELRERLFDRRFGGEVSVWWVIARGNLEHEAHHRGQIAAYLRALEDKTDAPAGSSPPS